MKGLIIGIAMFGLIGCGPSQEEINRQQNHERIARMVSEMNVENQVQLERYWELKCKDPSVVKTNPVNCRRK